MRPIASHLAVALGLACVASSCALPGATKVLGTSSSSGAGGAGQTSSSSTGSVACGDHVPKCMSADVGCQPISLGAFQGAYGADLAIVGDNLYFTTGDHNTVQVADYKGNAGVSTPSPNPMRIVTDGASIYHASYDGGHPIVRNDLNLATSTDVVTLASAESFQENYLATYTAGSTTTLYYSLHSPHGISYVVDNGTDVPHSIAITDPPSSAPEGLAVDGMYLYWGDADGVRRMKLTDIGGSNAIEKFSVQGTPAHQVAVDATNVYWTMATGIRSKTKSDIGAPLRSYEDDVSDPPEALTLDDKYIYWVTKGGVVEKADKTTGTITKLAKGGGIYNGGIAGIAVDCGAVYWTVNDEFNKTVVLSKAPK